jgi:hypothetical protein
VGIGSPSDAASAREASGYRGLLLADPEASSHEAIGLARAGALRHLLRPRALLEAMRARKEGHRQTKATGDPARQGATVAVGRGGAVLYAWRNATADDEAPLADAIAALPAGPAVSSTPS